MNILVVVDMQKDFIDGSLGTAEAQAIVPLVVQKMQKFQGRIMATRDNHESNYLQTAEGRRLPVEHCIKGTKGWNLHPDIAELLKESPVDKFTFGSVALGNLLTAFHQQEESVESITLVGLCTDICVISNALLLKAFLPEVPVIVDASCCAGVTPETHRQALAAMKLCQIEIENVY